MDNFTLKSCFIFDPTLKSKKKKPSDDEAQDSKLLLYYPSKEDIIIKRSNMGIIEGTMTFMESFEKTNHKFILTELSKCYYIASNYEYSMNIVLILQKTNPEFTYYQNVETKKKWFKMLIDYFYDMFFLFHGALHENFFPNGLDIRESEAELKNLNATIEDYIESFFEHFSNMRLPFLDYVLYFPLNEISHAQILLSAQRLAEKVPDIELASIMYKGYFLHNEAPLEVISLLYNIFFNSIDASPKFYHFGKPPYQVVQTVNIGGQSEFEAIHVSNFRKSFELLSTSDYLIGIHKMNINNYHLFMPTVYFKNTDEKYKLLVFSHNSLILFLFINENFNPSSKISSLIKMEKWAKRYFDEHLTVLESLYTQKLSKFDTTTFVYLNNSNKSIKLSSTFFNKKTKLVDKEKFDLLITIAKMNNPIRYSSLTKIHGYYVYYIVSCQRKVTIILPDSLSLVFVRATIEEIKKDLFDYIFIL